MYTASAAAIYAYRVPDMQPLARFDISEEPTALAHDPTEDVLYVGTKEGTLRALNSKSGEIVAEKRDAHNRATAYLCIK